MKYEPKLLRHGKHCVGLEGFFKVSYITMVLLKNCRTGNLISTIALDGIMHSKVNR